MDELLHKISAHAFSREVDCINEMLPTLAHFEKHSAKIHKKASEMVGNLRKTGMGVSVEAFLTEYDLGTKEGVAIMCLAEALLRIPNRETADKLIESTFDDTNWKKHLGHSDSFLVNASSWALLLTGKTINFTKEKVDHPLSTLRKMANKSSDTVIRKSLKTAMHIIARQFVMGETINSALEKARKLEKQGYIFSYDMLGEGARNQSQAEEYYDSYLNAIGQVADAHPQNDDLYSRPSISIKLTALHPRYELLKLERVEKELYPKLKELVKAAQQKNICIAIDAEEATRLDIEIILFKKLRLDEDFADFAGIGFVLQAYQKRAWKTVDFLVELAQFTNCKIPIRLVKGAYWDSEIKHAQIHGLKHYPVFTNKHHSDVSYLACARKILDNDDLFFAQFATHNAHTIAAIQSYAGDKKYEFQRLYGMGEKLYEPIVKHTPCRIYAPIGRHEDLLAYLIRRLLENGANSSFVNMIMDKSIPVEDALQDPIAKARELGGRHNATLPLPSELYGERRENPLGVDYGNRAEMDKLKNSLLPYAEKEWKIKNKFSGEMLKVHNPARKQEIVGQIKQATEKDADSAAKIAAKSFPEWKKINVHERAEILRNAGKLLQKNQPEILALLIREAGKTIKDAIAELREAIDFCNYYAEQAENLIANPLVLPSPTGESNSLSLHPRGTFLCISPWNFPLAIFIGQITAALACGNSVIAKPAEQTPLIAYLATEILHEAGIPKNALQLLTGKGSVIGAALVNNSAIKGVCFTGSTATAKYINRALAEREGEIIPFIAETGGQNCMIADSSALPEQLCDDVINSAFGSAGQRCSALRVLYLPKEIAKETIGLISGALTELQVGDPWNFASDIPPVIDADALLNLQKHETELAKFAKNIGKLNITANVQKSGHFLAPQIWKIKNISELKKENFGPILHIIEYDSKKLSDVIEEINNSGFGLTFGMHSRIHESYENIAEIIEAGNIYINRNMTGAVVGVQPFGGEKMSGTGFKAGGPNYLLRFLTERTTTINTAAIGGNIELLVRG